MKLKKAGVSLGLAALMLTGCGTADKGYEDCTEAAIVSDSIYDTQISRKDTNLNLTQKVIYSGTVDLSTNSITEASSQIHKIVKEYKCEIAGTTENTVSKYANYTILVPKDSFMDVMNKLSEIGKVDSRTIYTENITFEYREDEENLAYYQKQLEEAKKGMDTEQEEYYQNQIRQTQKNLKELQKKVDYAEITVDLTEVSAVYNEDLWALEGFVAAWSNFWINFANTGLVILTILMYAMPLILLAALIIFFDKWNTRRKEEKVKKNLPKLPIEEDTKDQE